MEQSVSEGKGNKEKGIADIAATGLAATTGVDREVSASEVSLGRRFFNLQTLLSFVASFAILYFVVSNMRIDPGQIVERVRQANLVYYAIALVVYYMSFIVRAWRWEFLLRNVGFIKREGIHLPSLTGLTRIILLSWFANCIVPAKLGDAYRGYLLKGQVGVSFSKTLGTVLAERMIDLVVLFVLLLVAGLEVFRGTAPAAFGTIVEIGAALVVVIAICLLAMLKFGSVVKRLLPSRIESIYERFQEGTVLSFQNLPVVFIMTIGVWTFEIGRLWFILFSLGIRDFSPGVIVFVALASSLLTTVPFTPAGLGLAESGLVGLLLLMNSNGVVHGIDEIAALAIVTLDRTVSYWSLVLIGLLIYLVGKRDGIGGTLRRMYCASASTIQRR